MAAVEIWLLHDLAPDLAGTPARHRKVFAFQDSSGLSGEVLAERVWTIFAGVAPHRLDPAQMALRDQFDAAANGKTIAAGDWVVVDGRRFVCRPDGWDHSAS